MGAHTEVKSKFSGILFSGLLILASSCLMMCCVSCVNGINFPSFSRVALSRDNIDRAMTATVGFVAYDDEGEWVGPFCSGFFVSPNRIVSAAHCFQAVAVIDIGGGHTIEIPTIPSPVGERAFFSTRHEVRWRADVVIEPTEAEVILWDNENDLVVLKVLEEGYEAAAFLPVTTNTPFVGDYVYHVGHPLGIGWGFFEGIVSNIIAEDRDPLFPRILQVTVPTSPGSSGGVLVNSDGEVVGIADSIIGSSASHMNVYHTSNVLLRLLAAEEH